MVDISQNIPVLFRKKRKGEKKHSAFMKQTALLQKFFVQCNSIINFHQIQILRLSVFLIYFLIYCVNNFYLFIYINE